MTGVDVHLGLSTEHLFKDGRKVILPLSIFVQDERNDCFLWHLFLQKLRKGLPLQRFLVRFPKRSCERRKIGVISYFALFYFDLGGCMCVFTGRPEESIRCPIQSLPTLFPETRSMELTGSAQRPGQQASGTKDLPVPVFLVLDDTCSLPRPALT